MDDADLLRDFARTQSEGAFRQLVDRYLPLVIGVALRRTGNRELSEEIAQDVFAVLARRAGHLKSGTGLAGWLHRTAVNQTKSALRADARHRRKIQSLTESMTNVDTMSDHLLKDVLPILDEALDQLPKTDRELILLRFYEGRSFREIAPIIDRTEATSQKRTRRALAKLSEILKRKGVAMPATALSAGLLSSLAHYSASAPLVQSITQGAIASASSLSSKTILTNICIHMSAFKTIAGVGLLVLIAIPLTAQRMEISKMRSSLGEAMLELRTRQQTATQPQLLAARSTAMKWRERHNTSDDAGRLDPYVLSEEVNRSHSGSLAAMVALERKLESFDAAEIDELYAATLHSTLTTAEKERLLPLLLSKLIAFAPGNASKLAINQIAGRENNGYSKMLVSCVRR